MWQFSPDSPNLLVLCFPNPPSLPSISQGLYVPDVFCEQQKSFELARELDEALEKSASDALLFFSRGDWGVGEQHDSRLRVMSAAQMQPRASSVEAYCCRVRLVW
jgi:hypothetical protein